MIKPSLITEKLFGNCATGVIQNIRINIVCFLRQGYSRNGVVMNQTLVREGSKKSLRQWNVILHWLSNSLEQNKFYSYKSKLY